METTASTRQIRQALKARLIEARSRTDELFHILRPEAFYERHGIVFYLGHLQAFDVNLLGGRVFARNSLHQEFDRLFAFGIDAVGGLPDDKPADSEIERYNQHVRHTMDACLESASFEDPAQPLLRRGFILYVAIEHRLMHAETAYMLHQLPLDRKFERPIVPAPAAPPARAHRIEIPAGRTTLGRARSRDGDFGGDNQIEAQEVEVPGFAIDADNVTNADRAGLGRGTASGLEHAYPWGHELPGTRHGNFDFRHRDPTPVGAHAEGVSALGVVDLVGNGWEWTRTPFRPLPGFEPFSFYPGYSADFFDD